MISLRWKDKKTRQVSERCLSNRGEGIICIIVIACCGFAAGVLYRFGASFIFLIVVLVIAILAASALQFRQVTEILKDTHQIFDSI